MLPRLWHWGIPWQQTDFMVTLHENVTRDLVLGNPATRDLFTSYLACLGASEYRDKRDWFHGYIAWECYQGVCTKECTPKKLIRWAPCKRMLLRLLYWEIRDKRLIPRLFWKRMFPILWYFGIPCQETDSMVTLHENVTQVLALGNPVPRNWFHGYLAWECYQVLALGNPEPRDWFHGYLAWEGYPGFGTGKSRAKRLIPWLPCMRMLPRFWYWEIPCQETDSIVTLHANVTQNLALGNPVPRDWFHGYLAWECYPGFGTGKSRDKRLIPWLPSMRMLFRPWYWGISWQETDSKVTLHESVTQALVMGISMTRITLLESVTQDLVLGNSVTRNWFHRYLARECYHGFCAGEIRDERLVSRLSCKRCYPCLGTWESSDNKIIPWVPNMRTLNKPRCWVIVWQLRDRFLGYLSWKMLPRPWFSRYLSQSLEWLPSMRILPMPWYLGT